MSFFTIIYFIIYLFILARTRLFGNKFSKWNSNKEEILLYSLNARSLYENEARADLYRRNAK